MGVIVFRFDISQLGKQISSAELTPSTKIFLIDGDGKILYSKNEADLQTSITKYFSTSRLGGYTDSKTENIRYAGKDYITSINTLKYGWYLIAMIPQSDISNRISVILKIIIFTVISSLFLGVALCILLSKSITEPIKKLAVTMKSIKIREYFDISMEPPSSDEVGTLYESFNSMIKRINQLVEDNCRSIKIQKETELKALQAQINPHFLYNTLDSINWLALDRGEDDIMTMVSSLANIMRFNIRNPETLVTINEELSNVKNYIAIQSMRYENNFEITYDFQPGVLEKKCPKLMLQPLVENAIIHGTEKAVVKGIIAVNGRINGDKIEISVKDNGPGTNVKVINSYLTGGKTSLKNSDGFGIKNVDQRIKIHFGENFGLYYSLNDCGGVTCTVSIPACNQPSEAEQV